ncbi:trichohyalin-like isoform X3 [Mytilus californianus]|uniref:trichohyalin-like isoform X3 n=1 Tax=Mytilus californianus TaxID=6549 RepID=UPI002246925D|nr:trichohyalin-like isoform X3 [Mytilus californianus]
MSSLEERREARRRRRQQEEELDVKGSVTSPGLDDSLNIEKKQKEREDRLQRIAAGFSTINGEDELERRRKERREQRLRSGETETPSEDTSSRRSRRRRGTEDEIDTSATEEVTSTRSRRRRGEEEETDSAPVSVPEPEPESQPQVNNNAEEEESRRREEEEEAERQRQAAEEARRRQQEEEDRRRREDEERRQREEEDRRKREEESSEETDSESDMDDERARAQQKEQDDHERKIDEQLMRLKNLDKENDLLLEEEGWNGTTNGVTHVHRKSDERGKILSPKEPVRRSLTEYSLRTGEDGKCGKLKTFFEEKVEGLVNGDHNELSRSLNFSKKSTGHATLEDKSPVHEKWKKFEINQQTKDLQQETKKDLAAYQAKVISPGASRLKDIQKKFEDKTNTENSSSRLGRFSASESYLNEKPISEKDNKKHILDRWQSAVETKKTPSKTQSWLSKSMSISVEYDLNKKGDKIERLTSKFDHNRNEKPDKIVKSATLPIQTNKDMSSLKRQWSQNTEESVNTSDIPEQRTTNRHSVPRVTERWLHKSHSSVETVSALPAVSESRTRPLSTSSVESNKENQSDQQPRPDSWRRRSSAKSEEEERLERERQEAEEREREEAARQMEEQQKKKKGKRKGLGGLSPEKKKMLKKLIMQKAAEDLRNEAKAKAEEKEKYINERVGHLSIEGKAEGDLVKLCKQLHQQLSKLEEEVYDWEVKIRKQDQEIITLTLKVNDSKGKFAKPVLKKVNKTESKFKKLTSKTAKDKADFRDNLKSSGQSKFAIDEEEKAE